MSDFMIYDQFSKDYDRFVDWESRLAVEMPFLINTISQIQTEMDEPIKILDAACGTGQHVMALNRAGFQCAGADASEGMIEIAQSNAQRKKVEIQFEQAGFSQLADKFPIQEFSVMLCLGNSLPHVRDDADLKDTLRDFHSVLRPGGMLILQNRNFDQVMVQHERWMPPQTHREGDKTWVFSRFYDFDPDGYITFNIIIMYSEGMGNFQQQVISTRLWPIKNDQLVKMLHTAGFEDIQLYGDLQGSSFNTEKSGNQVVIARVQKKSAA